MVVVSQKCSEWLQQKGGGRNAVKAGAFWVGGARSKQGCVVNIKIQLIFKGSLVLFPSFGKEKWQSGRM